MTQVLLTFPSKQAALEFMAYMSEQGEQDMIPWFAATHPHLDTTPTYDWDELTMVFHESLPDGRS